jgi:hypothetical protein
VQLFQAQAYSIRGFMPQPCRVCSPPEINDFLSRLLQAQQSPSHAMLHSRRESLTPSQTHHARVKYHDGEPDELDRIMHESRKEFPSGVNPGALQGEALSTKKGEITVRLSLSMSDYRWRTETPISSPLEPVPEPPMWRGQSAYLDASQSRRTSN